MSKVSEAIDKCHPDFWYNLLSAFEYSHTTVRIVRQKAQEYSGMNAGQVIVELMLTKRDFLLDEVLEVKKK